MFEITEKISDAMRSFQTKFGDIVPLREMDTSSVREEDLLRAIRLSLQQERNMLPELLGYGTEKLTCDIRNERIRKIMQSIEATGVAILPPMDVFKSMRLLEQLGIHAQCTMLDPWYNKGYGGVMSEEAYDTYIASLLHMAAPMTDTIYLWGFPEIIGPYVRYAPDGFKLSAWLTWYYKNCPSVIRGWRSSQNACIQFNREGKNQYPEHLLTEKQQKLFADGKMRYIIGPTSVIEEPLIIGFVGKKEQTGHPSQKPEAVYEKLILIATKTDELTFDPMAGSGTTGAVTQKTGRRSILCDMNEEYISMMEKRLGTKRIIL